VIPRDRDTISQMTCRPAAAHHLRDLAAALTWAAE